MAKKQTTKPDKTSNINRLIAEVNKKAGETVISRVGKMEDLNIPRIKTGIESVDDILGGGIPYGRMVELYGVPSSGKSLLSLLLIAECQRQGRDAVYVDLEESFDPEHAAKLGVDVDNLILVPSMIGEDLMDMLAYLLKADPGIIVIDSIAAMQTRGETEESVGKAFMAVKARLMSRALPKLNAMNRNTAFVWINQLRSTLAMYGPKFTTPGGNALKFYASIRLQVKRIEYLHEDDKKTKPVIGQVIGCKCTKNKTAAPLKDASFKYYYEDRKIE